MLDQEQSKESNPQTGDSSHCCGDKQQHESEYQGDHKPKSWWDARSVGEKVLIVIGGAILGFAFLALVGLVTMKLWNALMPDIFGVKSISYWQAWGLLILSCIFFRSWGSSDKSSKKKQKNKKDHCC